MNGTIGYRLRYALLGGVAVAALSAGPAAAVGLPADPPPVVETPAPEISQPAPSEPAPSQPAPPEDTPVPSPPQQPGPPPTEAAPSVPAAIPSIPAVPEQSLVDPVTGFQIERGSGYLIHPGTGYLIEPGTGNLIDGQTWLYTDLRWDPVTGDISNIFDDPEESPVPTESPKESSSAAAPQVTAKPVPTTAESTPSEDLSAVSESELGTDWGTHWVTRAGVILLLVSAGIVYYMKLRRTGSGYVSNQ